MIWILIASTGNQNYLPETIAGFQRIKTNKEYKIVASVYSTTRIHLDFPDVTMIYRDIPLEQFDHYQLLSEELPIDRNDIVILFDDDDIPLPWLFNEVEKGSFIGTQILLDNTFISKMTWNYLDIVFFNGDITKCRDKYTNKIVTDLSGTTTTGAKFIEYFLHGRRGTKILEDTNYIEFVENSKDAISSTKLVCIHRIKPEISIWRQKLKKMGYM